MAPSAGKSCYNTNYRNRNVRMLVAHKRATKHPLMKETDGAFFIDDKDCYTDVLAKMASHCMKPVSRIFYIDSDDDELPIDSDVEFKEALKLIGQRTDKGRFTSMRIETGELQKYDKKRTKKPSKVARVKVAAKLGDASAAKKGSFANRAESEPKLSLKNSVADESSVTVSKHGISHTWLKNYLHQFKKELMNDFESLLEPYIAEQKKMNDLITSLNASLISEKNCAGKGALANLKEHTESDHNYSACAGSLNAQVHKGLSKAIYRSEQARLKFDEAVPLSEDEEMLQPRSYLEEGDDDNLSIYSGEISVTESESDESTEDFVDVPLPSCFDVVAIQKGSAPKKVTKEMKHMKTSLKVKMGKVSNYDVVAKCEKPQQNANSFQNKKPEINSQLLKMNQLTPKQDNQPIIKSLIAPMEYNSSHDTIDGHFSDNEDYDEVEVEIEEDYVEIGGEEEEEEEEEGEEEEEDEEEHNCDCNYREEYAEEFDAGKIKTSADSEKQVSSSTYPRAFLDSSGNNVHRSDEVIKQQEYTQTRKRFEQNNNLIMDGVQEKYLQTDLPPSRQNVAQYNMVNLTHPNPQMVSKVPVYSAQSRHQPMFLLTGTTAPGSVSYMQFPEATTMPKHLQPMQKPLQQALLQTPPSLLKLPQPARKTLQTFSAQRFIETAQAAVQAQHQQFIRAAHRAAVQAQQTQAVGLSQSFLQQRHSPASFQENPATVSGIRATTNSQTPFSRAHELKLWNEVDHVDTELRKWVQMCKQLMDSIPKHVDDSSPTMPEFLKKFAITAGKTHQDLEKVYQNFRKEVKMVSTQMDARKQLKLEQGCGQLADDPIVILPEKLMTIISATLNTTFNILGNIAKLGVAPSSVPSEQTITSPSAEKPQPHKSANAPQIPSELGNTNNARFGFATQTMPPGFYQSYASPLSMLGSENAPVCGILADPLANQGRKTLTYRLRPCSTFVGHAGNQTYVWGHNAFAYNTPQTLGQTPQPPQQQTPPTMPRQLPQQVSSQLPLQLALHQQAMSQMASIQPQLQQMQPQLLQPLQAQLQKINREDISGRQSNPQDINRIETTYNGMQLHDFTPVATETTSACYPNLKTVPAGFCAKTYGGMMKN
ncbi:uncharacterized protein LOC117653739 isoform X2 [Thrips palmi]|nr:uncharacterized protein LOC117653739 isoform X2 [Thrips palmi]